MRLHRFYTTEHIGDKSEITISSTELVNQIQKVFRLRTDDSVIIFDGTGFDYECTISDITKENISLRITKREMSRYMPSREIILCAAVVKKDTFEWITEKAAELGVSKIIPVMAERSEKKSLNEDRLNKIAVEASEQSGRGDVPIIEKIMSLEDVQKYIDDESLSLKESGKDMATSVVFHLEGESLHQWKLSDQKDNSAPIFVFIGPEGGWAPRETEMFHENQMHICSLGSQVLRSETAVIATLSMVVFNV